MTEIIAWIATSVLLLQNAGRIPAALTELVRTVGPLLDAIRELRNRNR
ncbi:hypothetical protein ACQPXH_00575 [Nocardia sp. CA-135953]